MKAVILQEPENFTLGDVAEPKTPGAGDALVRVHNVGICGTDYAGYLGKMPFYSYPRIPGHELGVEVLAVGDDVENVHVGDFCSVEPYLNNPASYATSQGRPNCCEELQVLGVHCDGGLRPRFIVPARKLHKSTRLRPDQLALVETLAIGCHAVQRGNPQPDQVVLTIGAGPIGLSVLEFVRLSGATSIVMDLNEQRLEFCRDKMGVDHTIHFQGDGSELERLSELTDGKLAKLVVDATGNNKSMSHALNFVGFTGTLVFVGITTQEVCFPHPLMHRREMSLLASRNALPADFDRIIGHIERGEIDTEPWITHRTDMPGMIEQFATFLKPETGVIKAMVTVED
jgi:alcohol dehydrogenase